MASMNFRSRRFLAVSNIPLLADNLGGVANDTLQAIPDVAGDPLTAILLATDLTTNVLPAIRNDLTDLSSKVNSVITALRNAGIMS